MRRSYRQLVIEAVKANPGISTSDVPEAIRGMGVYYNSNGGHKTPRRRIPTNHDVVGICISESTIVNKGLGAYAEWHWVGDPEEQGKAAEA